jgi:lipoprotein-anchoring transpeptidase ErfK/SrfK
MGTRAHRRRLAVVVPLALVVSVGFAYAPRPSRAAAERPPRARHQLLGEHVAALAPTGLRFDPWRIVVPVGGGGLAVYPAVDAAAPSATLPGTNELGSPLVLLSLGQQGPWFHVLLPTRPNGSSGWVRAADVTPSVPTYRIEVSLAGHELRVLRTSDGAVVMTSPVGVGSPARPTPSGLFFVRDHFPTGSDNHPYGPFAFGLSAHSDVLTSFGTGDGRVAIHGTNQPASIGADVSNGCVHVPNDVVLALIPYMPLGTPVAIS